MKLLYKLKYIIESNNLVKMLMPSLLGIIICITCLMGTTWSWFTDNVTTSIQSIKAASYNITVDVEDGEKLEEGKYILSQKTEGNGYQVTVTANEAYGSASTGYFRISGPEGFLPLYSTQLAPGEVMTFTFYPDQRGEYYFESAWGTYSREKGITTINDSDIIGTPKQSEENMDDTEESADTEISNDAADSTPAPRPNEEENLDKDLNGDSDEELDDITSTVQPTEDPDDTEKTFPPHISNGESVSEDSVEQPTNETAEETSGNTEQN
ncbi:hypothetical protein [Bacillus sp. FJAT-27986]|uniref:hypothetical protein n=1 Tax=Bacillus sp. FJAT-27986 TaxID=1743146 RepID=UPI00080ACD04|nr:hypothetical protein [Bacillus sp. FJAT-27986]OCA80764.1 hypothetical protein A8L44_16505 [Bacillus sp. FJAT-27986]